MFSSQRRTAAAIAILAGTTVLLAACSSAASDTGAPGQQPSSGDATKAGAASAAPSPSRPPLATVASPKKFGTSVPITLRAVDSNLAGDFTSRFLMVDDHAYGVTSYSLGEVDLATGATSWEADFPHADKSGDDAKLFYDGSGPGAPILSPDGNTVYAAVPVYIPGSGTTEGKAVVELMAADAKTGKINWTANMTVGSDAYTQNPNATVVSADDRTVIVTQADSTGPGITAAFDITSHHAIWKTKHTALAVANGSVLVSGSSSNGPQIGGLDVATGKRLWFGHSSDSAAEVSSTVQTADGRLLATITPFSGDDPYVETLDPKTGKASKLSKIAAGQLSEAGDDLLDQTESGGIQIVDPGTMKPLWHLPQGDRGSLTEALAFGGLVYGRDDHGTSVILDQRTGKDATGDIPGIFVAVNQHGAIMIKDKNVVFARAIV